jgi:hypothetical protein
MYNAYKQQGLRGPMDKALVYETRDSGFDPQRSRFVFLLKFVIILHIVFFFESHISQDGRVV